MTRALPLLLAGLAAACSEAELVRERLSSNSPGAPEQSAAALRVPRGFAIELFAEDLRSVRTLKLGPDGLLYAALSERGRIVRLDPTAAAPRPQTVAEGLRRPYGLAFHEGDLYVGEEHRVVRLEGPSFARSTEVVPGLPTGGHWTREIDFGPDGMLYVSVGSSCNVCEENDERRAAVTRYRPNGSGARLVAGGLRNAVGLAVHPETGEIWASQNERGQPRRRPPTRGDQRPRRRHRFRLALLLRSAHPEPRIPRPGRALRPHHASRARDAGAFGAARHDILYGRPIPGGIPAGTCSSPSTDRGIGASPRAISSRTLRWRADVPSRTSPSPRDGSSRTAG